MEQGEEKAHYPFVVHAQDVVRTMIDKHNTMPTRTLSRD